MTDPANGADQVRVVLADANVLYSRVLRDYLLYAARERVISILWSPEILREVTEHLKLNVAGFDEAAAQRLTNAMNLAYPLAEVEPSEHAFSQLAEVNLADENDRHVLAAAITAEATVLCTANISDFPARVVGDLGLEVLTPDQLLTRLAQEFEAQMLAAHRTTVVSLPGASDKSTIAALRRAGAPTIAEHMARLLGVVSMAVREPPRVAKSTSSRMAKQKSPPLPEDPPTGALRSATVSVPNPHRPTGGHSIEV